MHKDRTLFQDAIDIPLWLEADRNTPYAQRIARDRCTEPVAQNPAVRVRNWWRSLAPTDSAPSVGEQLDRSRRWITIVMTLLGGFSGMGLAVTVLHYDGTHPVNTVTVFSVLVALQSLLFVITLLLLLPNLPGLRAIQSLLGQINPAAIVAAIYRRARGANLPAAAQSMFDWHVGRAAASRFSKWQVLRWSTSAAIAFNAGALVTALMLVTFTDLAFGWSTTLRVSAAELERAVGLICAPWAAVVPAAVPTTELIESSRFFRLERSSATIGSPESYTLWWPFLMMSMIVYGLLPRLFMWILTGQRLRSATRALLLEDPRVVALLDRMGSPTLVTAAAEVEHPRRIDASAAPARATVGDGHAAALIWADAIGLDEARERARSALAKTIDQPPATAGGGASMAEDVAAMEHLVRLAPQLVIVFVRAWEPPLLELMDMLRTLRARLPGVTVIINPVPEPGGDLAQSDVNTWHRTITALGDPRIFVEAGH